MNCLVYVNFIKSWIELFNGQIGDIFFCMDVYMLVLIKGSHIL